MNSSSSPVTVVGRIISAVSPVTIPSPEECRAAILGKCGMPAPEPKASRKPLPRGSAFADAKTRIGAEDGSEDQTEIMWYAEITPLIRKRS